MWFRTVAGACRSLLKFLARTVKGEGGRGGIIIRSYRGYGSRDTVFLMGRVFRQPGFGAGLDENSLIRDLVDIVRALLRRGVGDAVLLARFGAAEQRATTDRDGYFRIRLELAGPPAADRHWHSVAIELIEPRVACPVVEGMVFIPPPSACFVVISDIDDTIMDTGVANKALMLWRLFAQGAHSRVAFPGVAAFCRALHCGASGAEFNPMLYVSRAPWSIYEVLEAFFTIHRIPVGPVLFLREWGLTLQNPLPRRGKGHKLALIREMLSLYDDLPFVLLGDSGQRDPEIYAQVVRENPGRVLAIYIRNVRSDPQRVGAIEALAVEVAGAGSTLLLAADSVAMAKHAATHGFIDHQHIAEVRGEREARAEPQAQRHPAIEAIRHVEQSAPGATQAAVAQGALQQALDQPTADGSPANVEVAAKAGTETAADAAVARLRH